MGYRAPLLDGESGTAQTIALMRKLVDQALQDQVFIRKAVDIVRGVPEFDDFGEAEAIYHWVKRTIRYTKDPVTKEKLYPPQELLKIRAGDCDDISMLMAGLLLAVGYPARFITVSANAQQPDEFSHVYVEAEVPSGSGNWIPMDAARLNSDFGAEPPVYFRKRAWSVTDDSYQDLSGGKRRLKLAGYNGIAGMGDDGSGIDWSQIGTDVATSAINMAPTLTAIAMGQPVRATIPGQGTIQTGSPYGSFMTPYTPGYGIPQAGYSAAYPGGFSTMFSSSSLLPILLGLGVVVMLARRS